MSFSITYRNLFEVVFRHDYLLNQGNTLFEDITEQDIKERKIKKYNIQDIFSIEPSRQSRAMMKGLGMIFKPTATGFFVALKVEPIDNDSDTPDYAPFTAIPEGLVLQFHVRVRDPYFLNYTNLPFHVSRPQVLCLSNATGSNEDVPPIQVDEPPAGERIPSLSRAIPDFDDATTYPYSALVRQADTTFLSLVNNLSQSPADAPDSWKALRDGGFVNNKDFSRLYPMRIAPDPEDENRNTVYLRYHFPEGGVNNATVTLLTLDGEELAKQDVERIVGDRPIREIELNAGPIADGRYVLQATGEKEDLTPFDTQEDILLDSQHSNTPPFGYIEIVNDPSPGPYALLDADNDNIVRSPRFGIHFLNRHTFWRYIYQNELTQPPGGNLEEVDGQFVTTSIQPLTTSYIRITDDIEDLLPNPGVSMIKPEDTRVYSDIFIHN